MNGNVLIQVKGLKKYYCGDQIKALDGIDADIKKGEVVVIIGPSGSGKSTLLRSLNLLETPTEGHIIFDGVDINGKKVNINIHRQKTGRHIISGKHKKCNDPQVRNRKAFLSLLFSFTGPFPAILNKCKTFI